MRMVVELEGYSGFDVLHANSWSGAIESLDVIKEYHMEEELMEHLEMLFNDCGEYPTDTQINDYLWHEFSAEYFVAENIAFNTLDDLDELEQYAEDLYFTDAKTTITEVKQQNKEKALWKYLKYGFDMRNLYEVMVELKDLDIEELK